MFALPSRWLMSACGLARRLPYHLEQPLAALDALELLAYQALASRSRVQKKMSPPVWLGVVCRCHPATSRG
jgi:hypothetical protein